jgi:hypothetical protein
VTINSMFVDNDGELNAQAQAAIVDLRLEGTAFFRSDSAGSTIDTLRMEDNGATLNLDGSADLSILDKLIVDQHGTINAPNTSTLTVQKATDNSILDLNLANEGAADVQVVGTFTLGVNGTLNVNDGILLTVGNFQSDGTVNVNENAGLIVEHTSYLNNFNVIGVDASALFQSTGTRITNLTITNGGLVTLQAINQAPSQSLTSSIHALIVNNLNLGSVTSPTGTLDLTDGAMIVDYGGFSPKNDIRTLLISGFNLMNWNGLGINSSSAADPNSSTHYKTALGYAEATQLPGVANGTFAGQQVDSSAIIVRYTWYGDANLDGGVDVTDLGALATNWQTNGEWVQGNFNYDYPPGDPPPPNIDVSDLGLIATNWHLGVTNPSSQSFQDAWDALTGG